MTSSKKQRSDDRELEAISSILEALDELDGESIQRVLDYVFSRLSIPASSTMSSHVPRALSTIPSPLEPSARSRPPSIRDLKEEKQPESANQMAALVAYYLSEVLSSDEAKEAVNTADLEKYFKQAGFKLPKTLSMTLSNATAAGYFDSLGGGLYKLNPVGYNLVVHALPRSPSKPRRRSGRPRKRGS